MDNWLTVEEWWAIRLSLQVAVTATVASLPLGIALGYLLARRVFPGKILVETLVNLPLVLPPVVTGYALLVLFGRQGFLGRWLHEGLGISLVFHWTGAAVASAVMGFPLMVRAIRLAFAGFDPGLEQMARTLGAGRLDTFLTITVPLARRGLIAGALLAFARSLGEFGATIMIAGNLPGETQTIPSYIYSAINVPGGIEQSARIVLVSVILALGALGVSEWLERRGREARP